MDGTEYIQELEHCLEEGFSAPIIEAMLRLADDDDVRNLRAAWIVWSAEERNSFTRGPVARNFATAIEELLKVSCSDETLPRFCRQCDLPNWETKMTSIENDEDLWVCDRTCLSYYAECDRCNGVFSTTSRVNDQGRWCNYCCREYASFCDVCDAYFADDDGHSHDGCGCEAPLQDFEFPANGAGTISNDRRLIVKLPKGTITDEGLRLIRKHLDQNVPWPENTNVYEIVMQVGPLWQAKRGNFTRRLSTAFYTKSKYKLSPAVISEVGNLARAHSSEGSEWFIEVTRDLNQDAAAFYHGDSCWFTAGTYGKSRCALKSWGGFGLRSYTSFDDSDYPNDDPNGRAWVQPLNERLCPTHDTLLAHAYIVYNGYGALEGYMPARIIGYLAGKTYKKVGFSASGQYINNDTGFLVADEATCADTTNISLSYREHDQQDARSLGKDAA